MNINTYKNGVLILIGLILISCRTTVKTPQEGEESDTLGQFAENEWTGNEELDQTGRFPTNNFTGDKGKAISYLARDIYPFVGSLERRINIYHWYKRKTIFGQTPITSPVSVKNYRSRKRLQILRNQFWDFEKKSKPTKLFLGLGLYAATDPKQTTLFAGPDNNWGLAEIEVPIDYRIWDIRFNKRGKASGLFVIRPITFKFLKTTICPALPNRGKTKFLRESFQLIHITDFAENKECFQAFTETMNTLKINLIAYSYPLRSLKICDKQSVHNKSRTAFLVIDLKIKKMNTRMFVYDVSDISLNSEKYQEYLRIYHLLAMPGSHDISQGEWEIFKRTAAPPGLNEWAKKAYFGCSTHKNRSRPNNNEYPNDRTPAMKLKNSDLIPAIEL